MYDEATMPTACDEVDGTELPQSIVDEIARASDRVLLPFSLDRIPSGGEAEVEFEISSVPTFYLVSVMVQDTSNSDLWIGEVRVDGQIVVEGLRCNRSNLTRWRALARPARSGSLVSARVVNRSDHEATFLGGLVVALTESGAET